MTTVPLLAEIIGPDILIILVIVALLFGSSRLPKLARSLGSAKSEFEKGIAEGTSGARSDPAPTEEQVILTRAELDAMIAERETRARASAGPTSPPSSGDSPTGATRSAVPVDGDSLKAADTFTAASHPHPAAPGTP